MILLTLSILLLAAYGTVSLVSSYAVSRFAKVDATTAPPESDQPAYPPVSVVVAARNEEESLGDCIEALLAQDYPAGIEIIVVDDASTDKTFALASSFADKGVAVHSSSERDSQLTGKARPLDLGFRVATNNWVATTDADCRPPEGWLKGLVQRALSNPDLEMVCGCTVVSPHNMPSSVQRIDWLQLLCIASGLSLAGRPLTAMGNNMLLRRDRYLDLGGYEGIGDSLTEDFHLFQAFGKSAEIVPLPTTMNRTLGETSFGELFMQKQRWLAGGLVAPVWVWLLYLTFALSHVGILYALVAAPLVGFALFLLKISFDVALIRALSSALDEDVQWRWFIPFQLYQLAGILIIPALLLTRRGVHWRGRAHGLSPTTR